MVEEYKDKDIFHIKISCTSKDDAASKYFSWGFNLLQKTHTIISHLWNYLDER